jgi:Protein of unknown function (DUF3617)
MRALQMISIGISITCIGAAALLSAHAADNTPLKVKPGLWEVTTEGQNSGTPPIPPEMLANMDPQRRAQMEEHYKEMMAKQAQKRVAQRCLTQQDIDEGFDKMSKMNQGKCNQTVTTSTATLREGQVQCSGATSSSSSTYHFEAPTPETLSGNTDTTTSVGGQSMHLKNTIEGHWVGADCGDVKPGSSKN